MAINREPIQHSEKITLPDGTISPYFAKWLQERLATMAETDDAVGDAIQSAQDVQDNLDALRLTDLADYDDAAPPANGQVPTWDDTANKWRAETPTGGGGGSLERTRVVPATANFTLQNPAASIISDDPNGGGVFFNSVDTSAGIRFVRSNATLPAAPYSVITRSQPIMGAAAGYPTAVILRNGTTGAILIFGAYANNQELVQNWSSYASFAGNVVSPFPIWSVGAPVWRKIKNTGTVLEFYHSPDGYSWAKIGSQAISSYLGAVTEVGFGAFVTSGVTNSIFQSFEVV